MSPLALKTVKQMKKIIIAVIGFTVLLIGLLLIILPGPALIVIPLGLGILATQFVWARRLLEKMKNRLEKVKPNFKRKLAMQEKPGEREEEFIARMEHGGIRAMMKTSISKLFSVFGK